MVKRSPTDVDLKFELKESGLWSAYIKRRDTLKAGGMRPVDARKCAEEDLTPQLNKWRDAKFGNDAMPEESNPVISIDIPERLPSALTYNESVEALPTGTSTTVQFEGKTASIVEAIQWVSQNLENTNVTPEDAPCSEAWGMLVNYAQSAIRKADFWEKVFVKLIPSRSQLDTDKVVDVDGIKIVDAIDRLIAIREKDAK